MAGIRKIYEGVWNIVRFNWHFYVLSAAVIILAEWLGRYMDEPLATYINIICALAVVQTTISLLVSFYIYDASELYKLSWLNDINIPATGRIINIHAGFDESSVLLQAKFPHAELSVYDFYDPEKHTEVSIKRARKAYPPYPNTRTVTTSQLPTADQGIDAIFVMLSAHEIRDAEERANFFKELKRSLKPNGHIIVIEHLRDLPNVMAYSIGFFHFLSKASWLKTFVQSELILSQEIKVTPFITTFILRHGTTS
jgi:SAM-dependent methyltransferase